MKNYCNYSLSSRGVLFELLTQRWSVCGQRGAVSECFTRAVYVFELILTSVGVVNGRSKRFRLYFKYTKYLKNIRLDLRFGMTVVEE